MTDRRLVLTALLAAPLALSSRAAAQPRPVTRDDVSLGPASAPVTVVEYASLACPICARWHNEVFGAFKAKYVDTGQVRFVFREMLAHNPNFAIAATLLARLAGDDRYFEVVDAVFRDQARMEATGQYGPGLLAIAQSVGLTEAQVSAYFNDRAVVDATVQRIERMAQFEGVNSTPTFLVNGKKIVGFQRLDQLDAAIAEAKAAL